MKTVLTLAVVVAGAAGTANAQFWADNLVNSEFVTFYGSGLVTGAPDGGGAFLSDGTDGSGGNSGSLVLSWDTALTAGDGVDLIIVDNGSNSGETVDISVSADGVNFTYVGTVDAVNNQLDFGVAFNGGFSFVRLDNPDLNNIIDIDAVGGFFQVPSPAAAGLLAGAGLLAARRRRA